MDYLDQISLRYFDQSVGRSGGLSTVKILSFIRPRDLQLTQYSLRPLISSLSSLLPSTFLFLLSSLKSPLLLPFSAPSAGRTLETMKRKTKDKRKFQRKQTVKMLRHMRKGRYCSHENWREKMSGVGGEGSG